MVMDEVYFFVVFLFFEIFYNLKLKSGVTFAAWENLLPKNISFVK